jgi:hypothetical protein
VTPLVSAARFVNPLVASICKFLLVVKSTTVSPHEEEGLGVGWETAALRRQNQRRTKLQLVIHHCNSSPCGTHIV